MTPNPPATDRHREAARLVIEYFLEGESDARIDGHIPFVAEILARCFPGGEEPARCPSCGSDLPSYRGSAYDLPNRRHVECGNKFHNAASPQPSREEQ